MGGSSGIPEDRLRAREFAVLVRGRIGDAILTGDTGIAGFEGR